MANQHEAAYDNYVGVLDNIEQGRKDVLARDESLSANGLMSMRDDIIDAYPFVETVRKVEVTALPLTCLNALISCMTRIEQQLAAVGKFAVANSKDPTRDWNQIVSTFRSTVKKTIDDSLPLLGFAQAFSRSAQEIRSELDSTLAATRLAASEIQSLSEASREAAKQVGVSQYAGTFSGQAKEHSDNARNWLIATIVLLGSTVCLAYIFLHHLGVSGLMTDAATVQGIIVRLIAVSFGYVSVMWSSRNYRAHQHQYVVNRHRQLALQTFETFAGSTKEPEIKNAILLAATHCIFSSNVSGNLPVDEEQTTLPIIDIIKSSVAIHKGLMIIDGSFNPVIPTCSLCIARSL